MPSLSYSLLERDLLPDWLIRAGIRRLLAQRLIAAHGRGVLQRDCRLLSQRQVEEQGARNQHQHRPKSKGQVLADHHGSAAGQTGNQASAALEGSINRASTHGWSTEAK